ncbi:MAG TPA: sugar acetyltransferase [Rhodospirillaceae bacterium]|nr:sugar acetyltransferase [Rhodospirillaceae bacterium]|tara:strand:+ start:314 stop:949 length:636 start_codon:yes stop_codon:yes gene_type:complete
MTRPLLIIGAGGHGTVVLDAARVAGLTVLGLADADPARRGTRVLGAPVIGDDDDVLAQDPAEVLLVLGIGSTADTARRRSVYDKFKDREYSFATVRHPSAVVAEDARIGAGTVVMAGAVIQPRCRIGENVIVNTGARIDHDGAVEDHVHVAPGAVLSGNVALGAGAHVGVGATVLQGVTVGADAVCGAGAVVIRDVAAGRTVVGNPARETL